MNADAQQLLHSFDRLGPDDQREVAREILRRTADFDIPAFSDEELIEHAEELFLKLDETEEAADAEES